MKALPLCVGLLCFAVAVWASARALAPEPPGASVVLEPDTPTALHDLAVTVPLVEGGGRVELGMEQDHRDTPESWRREAETLRAALDGALARLAECRAETEPRKVHPPPGPDDRARLIPEGETFKPDDLAVVLNVLADFPVKLQPGEAQWLIEQAEDAGLPQKVVPLGTIVRFLGAARIRAELTEAQLESLRFNLEGDPVYTLLFP